MDILEGKWIDLILSDVHMPVMDGFGFIRALREKDIYKDTPVVFVTTEANEDRLNQLMVLGGSGYIRKPFRPEEIRALLGRIMGETDGFRAEQVLRDVISEVLEAMFFAMVDFEECGPGRPFDYESEIHLLNHNGRIAISLRVSEGFARMLTANFLGIEEYQVNDDDLEDSLKELANMVGGGYHAPSIIRIGNWGYPGSGRSGLKGWIRLRHLPG